MRTIKFQADADLRQSIVSGIVRRQPTLDFRSANQAGLEGIQDPEVLDLAAKDDRVLVTHDLRTMPTEFGKFILTQESPGVLILSKNLSTNEAINALVLVWEASSKEEWINRIMTIPF